MDADLAFVPAQADGGASPSQFTLGAHLTSCAELIDGIGHEHPAGAAFEGCCGFFQEDDYGFGEIQFKLQSGFRSVDWKAFMAVSIGLCSSFFLRAGSLRPPERGWAKQER